MYKLGLSLFFLVCTVAFGQSIEPFMKAPFSGDHPVSNLFDHSYPFPFKESGKEQLSWWGTQIEMGYGGHDGYDWTMPEGTRITSVAEGEVVFAGVRNPFFCGLSSINRQVSNQNSVTLRHEIDGYTLFTSYAHLSDIFVEVGQQIPQGFSVGRSGNTGCSSGPHLHFEVELVHVDGTRRVIDPYGWRGSLADPWQRHEQGIASSYLWLEPPALFKERQIRDDFMPKSSVFINTVRYMGVDDARNPNNEFIEIRLNEDKAPNGYYLGQHQLVNDAGDVFRFPEGLYIYPKKTLRVYSGQGQNSERRLYLNADEGIWNDVAGCVRLQKANGQNLFYYNYNKESCDP